ncbi:metallophosphoesterase family protein [Pseudooceanicola sp. MF1-13]|uniref:metallophosphoesterase family protein n=1 Tax=Pseudooceanicola sp. MF1-13 TaxID=3379095 RepID=UPI0038921252
MPNAPLYVIPDIHGHADQLDRVLTHIEADGGNDARIIFLGDYVDRGPDSRSVLDRLIAGRDAGRDWRFLRGNHDRMMQWFMEPVPRWDPHWMVGMHWFHPRIGGVETMGSYGVTADDTRRFKEVHADAIKAVPAAHVHFLNNLENLIHLDGLLFVHAGIRPGVPLADQTEEDLIWIREPFLSDDRDHPTLVVHGHTALEQATHFGNRIDLDGGAAYGRPLVAAVFEGRDCWTLTDSGRQALTP